MPPTREHDELTAACRRVIDTLREWEKEALETAANSEPDHPAQGRAVAYHLAHFLVRHELGGFITLHDMGTPGSER